RGDRRLQGREPGEEHDGSFRRDLPQLFGELGPVRVGQAHVEERHVESGSGGRERLCSGGRRAHLVALVVEDGGEVLDQRLVVVDEQHSGPMGRHWRASWTSSMASSSLPVWKGFSKTGMASTACLQSGKAVMASTGRPGFCRKTVRSASPSLPPLTRMSTSAANGLTPPSLPVSATECAVTAEKPRSRNASARLSARAGSSSTSATRPSRRALRSSSSKRGMGA